MKHRATISEHPSVADAFMVDVYEPRSFGPRLVVSREFKLAPSRNANFQRAIDFISDEMSKLNSNTTQKEEK